MAKQYSNRSDLRNPAGKMAKTAVPGQTYGEAGKQLAAQDAVPMGAPSAPQPQMPATRPGSMGAFDRVTERPDEPVTAGAPVGAGPGPEVFGNVPSVPEPFSKQDLSERLRGIAMNFPSPVLLSFIRDLENS